ncbi:hypothetical protein Tco_0468761 [Tanacetum coccineum]
MELDSVSNWLGSDTSGCYHREERRIYVQAFVEAKLDEERFLKQKEKIKWLDVGDSNSAYFHKSVNDMNCDMVNTDGLFVKHVSGKSSINMVKPVSDEEIKAAMFSIGDDCAPGPDGFSSAFF